MVVKLNTLIMERIGRWFLFDRRAVLMLSLNLSSLSLTVGWFSAPNYMALALFSLYKITSLFFAFLPELFVQFLLQSFKPQLIALLPFVVIL